jgi:hypothetical protein
MSKILLAVFSGLLGTMVMMVVMLILPVTGLPKLAQPDIIAAILGMEEFVGWGVYFLMGAVFAVLYHYAFAHRLPIESNAVKGLLFGFVVFVLATAVVFVLPMLGINAHQAESSVIDIAAVSLIGHLIYGVMVAIIEHDAEEGLEA